MKPEEVVKFVKTHAEFMIVNDMAEELGIEASLISLACKKAGVKAITKSQQNKNYITSVFLHKTVPEIAKKLGISEDNVRNLYDELGLLEFKPGAPKESWDSPGKILGRYHAWSDKQTFLIDPRVGYHED